MNDSARRPFPSPSPDVRLSARALLSLYVLAGLPLGIAADLLQVYLWAQGMGLGAVGALSLLHLPYALKLLWGPLVDRSGHSRLWLLGSGATLALSYAGLASVSPKTHTLAFYGVALLMTTASSFYDVVADATFVAGSHHQAAAGQARANAWRLSSFKFAMVAVGNGGAVAAGLLGFRGVFWALVALQGLLLLAVPWRRLPALPRQKMSLPVYFRGLWGWLRGPCMLHAFAFVLAYKLAIVTLLTLERAWWLDRGLTLTELGTVGAPVSVLSTVAGAGLGSLLALRAGMAALLWAGIALQAVTAFAYGALTQWPAGPLPLAVGLALTGTCFGLSTAALMALITRLCRPPHAATQFAALTGTYALTRSLAGLVAGSVAQDYGYAALFACTACLVLPAWLLWPRSARVRAAWRLEG